MVFHTDSATRRPRTAVALAALALFVACGDDGPTGPSTPAPEIASTALSNGTIGVEYTESVAATGGGGGYEWKIVDGALPPGLGMAVEDPGGDDLIIAGVPEAAGRYRFDLEVRVEDGRADTASLSITIESEFGVGTIALAPGLVGYEYTVQLEAVGTAGAQVTWSVVEGSLPAGLSLSSTGHFNGSPTQAGTAEIVVEASVGEESVREAFTLVVHEEDTGRFNITVLPAVPIPAQLQDNVAEAVRRWESAIVGNLTRWDVPEGAFTISNTEHFCSGFSDLTDGTSIDDLVVVVNIGPIDGAGSFKPTQDGDSVKTNTIGSAGPCFIRVAGEEAIAGDSLPIVGVLTLDEYDLFGLEEESQELATDLIQHEIGHILGLGTLWQFRGLLEGAKTADPRYTGDAGIAAYRAAGGNEEAIPVENQGPLGSRDGHWRESVFGDPPLPRAELMIASLRETSFLSAMTIASYADFGYEVDTSSAEDELVLNSMSLMQEAPIQIQLHNDIGIGPVIGIDPDGRRRPVVPLRSN